jgi:hypothetical protein
MKTYKSIAGFIGRMDCLSEALLAKEDLFPIGWGGYRPDYRLLTGYLPITSYQSSKSPPKSTQVAHNSSKSFLAKIAVSRH